jgi:hypothetical protein
VSDYLARYQSQPRRGRCTADPALLERWEWKARWEGAAPIKRELAAARRRATELRKTREEFGDSRPELDLALRAAASGLDNLARDLAELATWARDYKIWCDLERGREEDKQLEAIAAKRWGDDVATLQAEIDLIGELRTPEGQAAFAGWLHAHGKYRECQLTEIDHPLLPHYAAVTDRRSAAAAVRAGQEAARPHRWEGVRGPHVSAAWTDHENYVAYRKKLAATAASVVASVASSQRLA